MRTGEYRKTDTTLTAEQEQAEPGRAVLASIAVNALKRIMRNNSKPPAGNHETIQ